MSSEFGSSPVVWKVVLEAVTGISLTQVKNIIMPLDFLY